MSWPPSVLTSASWGGVVLVQVTLVAVLGLLAWLLARKGGPALRGAVLFAALVGLLIVPGLARLAPTWMPLPECFCPAHVALAPPAPAETANPSPAQSAADLTQVAFQVELPRAKDRFESTGIVQNPTEGNALAKAEAIVDLTVAPETPVLPAPPRQQTASSWPIAVVLCAVWLLGVVLFLSRSALQLVMLYRCARSATDVHDPEWLADLASLTQRDGVPAVSLRESPLVTSPATLGLLRRVILLPVGRASWSAGERRLILEHELAHIRRRDFLAGLVVELVRCLCWFHPLVLWLAARLRLEQEYAADASVASGPEDAIDYIRCLARLALEKSQERRCLAPELWRRRPDILRRIDMLQKTPKGLPARLSKAKTSLVAIATVAACLAVAGVGPLGTDAVAKPTEIEIAAGAKEDPLGDSLPEGALARLGTMRLRHQGEVTFVSFVPGGKLLTAGQDNTVRLWDLQTGKEVRRFRPPAPVPSKNPTKGANIEMKRMALDRWVHNQTGLGGDLPGRPDGGRQDAGRGRRQCRSALGPRDRQGAAKDRWTRYQPVGVDLLSRWPDAGGPNAERRHSHVVRRERQGNPPYQAGATTSTQ